MAKKLDACVLLDFYDGFLTDRQRLFCELYFDEDLSLAEIAEREDVSRQAVRDAIVRGEAMLRSCEDRLGLCRRYIRQNELLGRLRALADDEGEPLRSRINDIAAAIAELWEDENGL